MHSSKSSFNFSDFELFTSAVLHQAALCTQVKAGVCLCVCRGVGLMPDCYITKKGYQIECEKMLDRRVSVKIAIASATYFLNDL